MKRTQKQNLLVELKNVLHTITVASQYAHWNIKGELFVTHHEFFQATYEKFNEYVDEVAEHIAQEYDVVVPYNVVLDLSGLDTTVSQRELNKSLFTMLQQLLVMAYNKTKELSESKSLETQDLCAKLMRDIRKSNWFVRRILEK